MSWRWAGKGLGWLALTGAVLVGMTLVLWWWGMDPRAPGERVGELNTAIAPWRTVLQVLRVILWCLAGYYWETLGQRRLRLTPDQLRQWMRLRRTVIGGLLILEGLIVLSRLLGAG
ncbi:hypothetical protein [Haliea salexigens]|uniref:hypothetical protein n=1 Tax=Haliea salexigens TaxID=287487 RepID=UPI000429C8F3|nr:hypothetical protein [Haliea salexigens]